MPTNIESVGMQIRRHARSNNDWKDRDKVDRAYTMLEEINVHLFKQELPPIVVGFSNDLKLKAGNYYYESDSIGVKYHFDIHPNLTEFDMFLALMHNAVHAKQEVYMKKGDWYHTAKFKEELANWGINVEKNGEVASLDPEVLENTLTKIGRSDLIPNLMDYDCNAPIPQPEPEPDAPKKKKPHIKWQCSCQPPTIVRCNTNLNAMCFECNQMFQYELIGTIGETQDA